MGNLQATGTKKNEITTIILKSTKIRECKIYVIGHPIFWNFSMSITTFVLKSTNPYLPDRVEFKHQFVKFEAGHAIYIKKRMF